MVAQPRLHESQTPPSPEDEVQCYRLLLSFQIDGNSTWFCTCGMSYKGKKAEKRMGKHIRRCRKQNGTRH